MKTIAIALLLSALLVSGCASQSRSLSAQDDRVAEVMDAYDRYTNDLSTMHFILLNYAGCGLAQAAMYSKIECGDATPEEVKQLREALKSKSTDWEYHSRQLAQAQANASADADALRRALARAGLSHTPKPLTRFDPPVVDVHTLSGDVVWVDAQLAAAESRDHETVRQALDIMDEARRAAHGAPPSGGAPAPKP